MELTPADQLELRTLWSRIREIEGDVVRLPDGVYDVEKGRHATADRLKSGKLIFRVGKQYQPADNTN